MKRNNKKESWWAKKWKKIRRMNSTPKKERRKINLKDLEEAKF